MAIGATRMRPGYMSWKSASLGLTRGGLATAVSASRKEEKVDQFGETVTNRWGFGLAKVQASATLVEMTAARMAVITGETNVAGVVKIKGTTGLGSNDLALAGQLDTFPIINGVTSGTSQVTMPLAFPQFDLNFTWGETGQTMKTEWGGLPNEADSNNVVTFTEV